MNIQRSARLQGFTLLELMITLVIAGMLAVFAVPAYNNYVIRAHRSDAQQLLMEIAQRQEQYLLDNRAYTADFADLNITIGPEILNFYDAPSINLVSDTQYVATIRPLAGGMMVGDGTLVIDNTLQTCRSATDDSCGGGDDTSWE